MPEVLEWQPNVIQNEKLIPHLVKEAFWWLFQAVYDIRRRVIALETATTTTTTPSSVVAAAQGILFYDVTLTADYVVPAPVVVPNVIIVWRFLQDATGAWLVSWPALNFGVQALIRGSPGKYNYVIMRSQPSAKFEMLWNGTLDGTP